MDVHLEQRELLKTLNERARGDLRAFWPSISSTRNVDAARDELIDLLPTIGDTYGDAAGLLASAYYDDLRTRAGAPGDFDPILVDVPGDERWVALAKWGTQPLMDDPGDPANWAVSMEKISGGLQRSIADQHRKTITGTAVADPRARGWSRVGVGDSCEFCEMLLTRGHVYTDDTVTFRSHDRCNCSAAPRFSNLPPPPRISPVDLSAKPTNPVPAEAPDPDEIVSVGSDTPVPRAIAEILNKWVGLRGSGTITTEERAALAKAIEDHGKPAPKVYRGLGVKKLPRPGEKVDLGPASSSTDIWSAEPYSTSADGIPVVYEFPSGVKGLQVSDRAAEVSGYAEEEWIVSGKFNVDRVRQVEDTTVVVLARPTAKKASAPTRKPAASATSGTSTRSVADLERRIESELRRSRSNKSSPTSKAAARENVARYRRELRRLKR